MDPYAVRLEQLLRRLALQGRSLQLCARVAGLAQEDLEMGGSAADPESESHLTGQELCEAIRINALEQFGYMALVVLRSWGLRTTSDFGEIVYNLIDIGVMNQSESDRREDFNDVYDLEQAFREEFRITNFPE